MTVAELVAKLRIDTDKGSVATANNAIEKISGGIRKLIVGYTALRVLRGGFSFLKGAIEDTTKGAVQASRAAQQLGMSVEQIQELQFAADRSGIPVDRLAMGLGKLAVTADKARQGSDSAGKILQRVGISAKDLHDKTLPLDVLLGRVADKFAGMKDGQQKAALANELFGNRIGRVFIPFLNQGAAGIEGLKKKALELGIVLSSDTIEKFKEVYTQGKDLDSAWTGLKQTIATALIPLLLKYIPIIERWVEANKGIIAKKIVEFIENLIKVLKNLAEVGKSVADVIISIGKTIGDMAMFLSRHTNLVWGMVYAWAAFKALNIAKALYSIPTAIAGFVRNTAGFFGIGGGLAKTAAKGAAGAAGGAEAEAAGATVGTGILAGAASAMGVSVGVLVAGVAASLAGGVAAGAVINHYFGDALVGVGNTPKDTTLHGDALERKMAVDRFNTKYKNWTLPESQSHEPLPASIIINGADLSNPAAVKKAVQEALNERMRQTAAATSK